MAYRKHTKASAMIRRKPIQTISIH